MNKTDIENTLKQLASARPIFWSEADFQFAFSELLRKNFPNAKIRLERGFQIDNITTYYVDIWVEENDKIYPIELKYKTKAATVTSNNETITIKNQSAEDDNRYAYVKDIKRIETIKETIKKKKKERPKDTIRLSFGKGYAIMLSNNSKYYDKPGRTTNNTVDADFRIHHGAKLSGVLSWKNSTNYMGTSNSNQKTRHTPITLDGTYLIEWNPYKKVIDDNGNNHDFKYCITEIY